MAAVILQYCDTRYVQKFADLLFHPASYRVGGQEAQVDSQVAHIKNYLATFHSDIAARLNLEEPAYKAKIANDWWLTGAQAVESGAADSVVTALKYYYEAPVDSGFLWFEKETTPFDSRRSKPTMDRPMWIFVPDED